MFLLSVFLLAYASNQRVQQYLYSSHFWELTLSSGQILDSCPPVEDHGGVVVHVKEGHLVVLLPQDEEDLWMQRESAATVCFRAVSRALYSGTVHSSGYAPCRWARWSWRRRTTSRLWPSEWKEEITCYPIYKGLENSIHCWSLVIIIFIIIDLVFSLSAITQKL